MAKMHYANFSLDVVFLVAMMDITILGYASDLKNIFAI